jgi:hypothetical protein
MNGLADQEKQKGHSKMPSPIRKPKIKKGGSRKCSSPSRRHKSMSPRLRILQRRRSMSGGYTGEPGIKHVFVTLFTDVGTATAEHEIDERDHSNRVILSTQDIVNAVKEYVSIQLSLGLEDVLPEFYEQSTHKTNGSVFKKDSLLPLSTGGYEREKLATFRVVAEKPTKSM